MILVDIFIQKFVRYLELQNYCFKIPFTLELLADLEAIGKWTISLIHPSLQDGKETGPGNSVSVQQRKGQGI